MCGIAAADPPKSGCFPGELRVISATAMIIVLFLLLSLFSPPAFAQGTSTQVRPKSLDPMNRPMDELGVTGKDDTLCSDRWYSCSTYDRQQFDQKYPGQRLKDMLRFGEPDWPDRPRPGYGSSKSDRSDRIDRDDRIRDRLDKY
jgi:hypothetical protein